MQFTVGSVLILISVVLFALAAFGVGFSSVAIIPLALAFFAAGHIV
jgi:hypothetical protein